jgi:protein CpxP
MTQKLTLQRSLLVAHCSELRIFTKLYVAVTESLRPAAANWRIRVGMQRPARRNILSAKLLEEIDMKKKILVLAGIAALLIGATVFALAQHPGMGEKMRMHGPGDMVEHMSRELNLTDAQKAQVKTLFEAQHATEEQRHTKLDDLRKQIEAATANGQFDENTVRNLASQQSQLMTDQMVDHLRLHSQIYGLLTAEQKTKADQMMKMHGERGPGGPGERGHHGPPPPAPGSGF